MASRSAIVPTCRRRRRAVPRANTATTDHIGRAIAVARGQRVLLDAELALLYGVTTKRLIEQLKCNAERWN